LAMKVCHGLPPQSRFPQDITVYKMHLIYFLDKISRKKSLKPLVYAAFAHYCV